MDSYLSGREQLGESKKKKDSLNLPAVSQGFGQLAAPESEDHEENEVCGEGGSKVAYVSEDGRVTKIVVTCNCGQITEIDCKYED
ncbi:hypothetical protein [Pelagicoccus sp. SDUM812002]|uniref:hypothetical protein n=1 Tax=Pelagicoccus sp. SDUM812002 TaxID=3041266 RepID=UPI00280E584C|nr:hypothetical protein [Pelagicoccus sp. SDUM812002]MDQ8185962.1 hypothetical protein [Pelagicoccus sp. SDUM812002]